MAKLIQAYTRYGPRVRRGKVVDHEEISAFIAASTGLDKHEIRMALGKLQDASLHYARQGRAVRLEGLLTLWPKINTKGQLSFGRRFDRTLEKELNDKEAFAAHIENEDHIGWGEPEFRNAWNDEFPNDPIEPSVPSL